MDILGILKESSTWEKVHKQADYVLIRTTNGKFTNVQEILEI